MAKKTAAARRAAKEELRGLAGALGTIEDLLPPDDIRGQQDTEDAQPQQMVYQIRDVLICIIASLTADVQDFDGANFQIQFYVENEYRSMLHIDSAPSPEMMMAVLTLVRPAVLERMYQLWCEVMEFTPQTPADLRKVQHITILADRRMFSSSTKGKGLPKDLSRWDPQIWTDAARAEAAPQDTTEAMRAVFGLLNVASKIVCVNAGADIGQAADIILSSDAQYVLEVDEAAGPLYHVLDRCAKTPEFLAAMDDHGRSVENLNDEQDGVTVSSVYWQTAVPDGFPGRKELQDLRTIGFQRTTVMKDTKDSVSWRYFVSSLPEDVGEFAFGAHGEWRIDALHTSFTVLNMMGGPPVAEKIVTANLGTLRKWKATILQNIETERGDSMRSRSHWLSHDPYQMLDMLSPMH